jgi:hypothetical protein
MSEERETVSPRLRIVLIVLVLANVLLFGYASLAPDNRSTAAKRIEELQINPGRIKLKGAATRGPAGQAAAPSKSTAYRACLEWGPFAAPDAGRAESALGRLALAQTPVQRPVADSGGAKRFAYFVREPDASTVAQIAELQRGFPGTEIKAGPCPF